MLWDNEPCLLGSAMMLNSVPGLPRSTEGCPACSAWGRRRQHACWPSHGLGSSRLTSRCCFPRSVPRCADVGWCRGFRGWPLPRCSRSNPALLPGLCRQNGCVRPARQTNLLRRCWGRLPWAGGAERDKHTPAEPRRPCATSVEPHRRAGGAQHAPETVGSLAGGTQPPGLAATPARPSSLPVGSCFPWGRAQTSVSLGPLPRRSARRASRTNP